MIIKPNKNRLWQLYGCNFFSLPLYFIGWWKLGLILNLSYTVFTATNQFFYIRSLKKDKAMDDEFRQKAIENNQKIFELTNLEFKELMKTGATTIKNQTVPIFKDKLIFD